MQLQEPCAHSGDRCGERRLQDRDHRRPHRGRGGGGGRDQRRGGGHDARDEGARGDRHRPGEDHAAVVGVVQRRGQRLVGVRELLARLPLQVRVLRVRLGASALPEALLAALELAQEALRNAGDRDGDPLGEVVAGVVQLLGGLEILDDEVDQVVQVLDDLLDPLQDRFHDLDERLEPGKGQLLNQAERLVRGLDDVVHGLVRRVVPLLELRDHIRNRHRPS